MNASKWSLHLGNGRYAADGLRVDEFLDIDLPEALLQDIVERNRFARLAAGRRFWRTNLTSDSGNANSHFRKGVEGDWHNYFKPEHVAKFKELLGDRLIDLGYESSHDWNNPLLVPGRTK